MKSIAIDIVLFPHRQLIEEVIGLNQQWDDSGAIPLNIKNCVPHITLAMGVVKHSDLTDIFDQLEEIFAPFKNMQVQVSGIYSFEMADGRKVFGLNFEKSHELEMLHMRSMEILTPFLLPPREDSIDPVRGLDEITLETIASLPQKSSFENYHPHLTIGFGALKTLDNITLNNTIEGMFVCQLANYCTCARVLKSFPFKT